MEYSCFEDIPRGAYDIIVADPPWTWSAWSDRGLKKSAQRHYSCMDLAAIKTIAIASLAAPSAVLILWATAPMLPQAMEAMKAWGFTYKSNMVWRKTTLSGKVRMGPGYWARTMHEQVLLGTRGKPRLFAKAMPSIFDGVARQHSRKPDEFYKLIFDRTPDMARVDLFGREFRTGFDVWGNEIGKFDISQESDQGGGMGIVETNR